MALPLLATAAIPTVANIIGGGIRAYKANKALKNLQGQPMPQYSLSPQLSNAYAMAQKNVNNAQGYTPEETAAFTQNLAMNNNAAFQRAKDIGGGNLSSAIGAGINYGNIGALNKFAASDAALRRETQMQNQGQLYNLAGQLQNQQNLADQAKIQQRMQLESAYGQALQQGLGQIQNAPGQFASIYTAGGGFGGSQKGNNNIAPMGAYNPNSAPLYTMTQTGGNIGNFGADPIGAQQQNMINSFPDYSSYPSVIKR